MRSTKPILLNIQKDLKQLCHENYHLFIEGKGKQNKPSIGYGEDVNNIIYNPLFEFFTILEDPSNKSSTLEPFDNIIGKEIYNNDVEDSDWFPIDVENYHLDAVRHLPFLPYKYKASIICLECPALKMIKEMYVPQPIHGIICNIRK